MGIEVKFRSSDSSITVKSKDGVLVHGEDGATFIPEINDDGVLSWSNNKDLENP